MELRKALSDLSLSASSRKRDERAWRGNLFMECLHLISDYRKRFTFSNAHPTAAALFRSLKSGSSAWITRNLNPRNAAQSLADYVALLGSCWNPIDKTCWLPRELSLTQHTVVHSFPMLQHQDRAPQRRQSERNCWFSFISIFSLPRFELKNRREKHNWERKNDHPVLWLVLSSEFGGFCCRSSFLRE